MKQSVRDEHVMFLSSGSDLLGSQQAGGGQAARRLQPLQEMRRSGSLGKVSSTVVFVTSAPSGHREWAEPDPQQPSGWLADSSPVMRCRCQTAASPFAVLGLDRSTLNTPTEDGTGTRTGVGSLDQFGRRPTGAGPRLCARARHIWTKIKTTFSEAELWSHSDAQRTNSDAAGES